MSRYESIKLVINVIENVIALIIIPAFASLWYFVFCSSVSLNPIMLSISPTTGAREKIRKKDPLNNRSGLCGMEMSKEIMYNGVKNEMANPIIALRDFSSGEVLWSGFGTS